MKRKTTLITAALIFVAALSLWYVNDTKKPSESEWNSAIIEGYKERWDIKLPQPDHIEVIWSSRGWFGDGESITMFDYTQSVPRNMLEEELNPITEVNLDYANAIIGKFVDDTLAIRNAATDISNVFEQHNVEVSIDDYYYYKSDSQGFDYAIALYKSDEQKLYWLEWYQ